MSLLKCSFSEYAWLRSGCSGTMYLSKKLFPMLKEKSVLKEVPAANPAASHHVHGRPSS